MKTKWYSITALTLLTLMLASFTPLPGVDTFEVYLDDKLLMNERAFGQRNETTLALDENSQSMLSIHYNHCGITGASRSLSIRDDKSQLLKQWTFADVDASVKDPMPVPVKEIVAIAGNKSVGLYYQSKELDEAVKLVTVNCVNKSTTSKQ